MKSKQNFISRLKYPSLRMLTLFTPTQIVFAHCDTLDGPVVMAARKALETGNSNYILIWVKAENEEKIGQIFSKVKTAIQSAKTNEAKKIAETELFEALVKIHREGEGAKYEGLKPAGSVEPEIALADKAVETGKLDVVLSRIDIPKNREIILHLFHKVLENSRYNIDDVASGREFVKSYVIFIHAVEKAMQGKTLVESELHNH